MGGTVAARISLLFVSLVTLVSSVPGGRVSAARPGSIRGRVEIKRYSTQRPKFAPYAFMATAFWSIALVLQLTVPYFRKFP